MQEKVRGALELPQEVAVVATNIYTQTARIVFFILYIFCYNINSASAGVLADERADLLYHNYTGGGVTIDGPSVLIRKNFAEKVSISANYYVDNITSASIDAVTQASEYTEERVQTSIGLDYLNDKSIISYGFTKSVESDFDASTHSFGISQDMFGSMTTVNLSFSIGFEAFSSFNDYRISLSQVLTRNLIMSLTYNIITDEGFLNNPYRQIRYLDSSNTPDGYSFQDELYPETRTTNAASISLRYYLPYKAALYGSYRYFTDSWGIKADTYEIGYIHPLESNWTFETSYRFYSQTEADFYNDLFPFENPQNVYARDKELSTFSDINVAFGVTYDFESDSLFFFDRGSANLFYTYMSFDYENFRDIRVKNGAGNEPLYSFTANVIRLYLSFWF